MVLVLCWSAAPRDPLLLSNASVSGVSVGSIPAETWRSVVISFVWVVSSCCVILGLGLIVPSAAPGWRSPVPAAAWGPWCSIRPRRGEGVPGVTSRILLCYVIHSATLMSLRNPPLQISTEITTLSLQAFLFSMMIGSPCCSSQFNQEEAPHKLVPMAHFYWLQMHR